MSSEILITGPFPVPTKDNAGTGYKVIIKQEGFAEHRLFRGASALIESEKFAREIKKRTGGKRAPRPIIEEAQR